MAQPEREPTVPSTAPGRISGVCATESGEPLAAVRINVYAPDGSIIDTQVTNQRGQYATRLLYAGTYTVEARIPERGLRITRDAQVRLGEVARVDFPVALPSP